MSKLQRTYQKPPNAKVPTKPTRIQQTVMQPVKKSQLKYFVSVGQHGFSEVLFCLWAQALLLMPRRMGVPRQSSLQGAKTPVVFWEGWKFFLGQDHKRCFLLVTSGRMIHMLRYTHFMGVVWRYFDTMIHGLFLHFPEEMPNHKSSHVSGAMFREAV